FDNTTALFFNAAGIRTTTGGGAFGYITTHNSGSVELNSLNFANIGNASISLAFATSTIQFSGAGAAINNNGTGSIDLGGTNALRFDTASLTIGGSGIGTTNISGTLAGTQGLTINQTGISSSGYMGAYVNLTSANTAITTTGVTLNNGILNLGNANSLGASGLTATINGGFLRSSAAIVLANPLSIGAGGLNIVSPSGITVSSANPWSGSGGVTLRHFGTVVELQANMTYSGATLFYPLAQTGTSAGSFGSVVSTGSFVLSGLSGRLSNTSSVMAYNGLIQFGTNGSGNNDRIPDATPFSLHNGTIVMTGTNVAGTPQTETLGGASGALSTFSGQNLIQAAPSTSSAQITLAGFTRLTNSTFVFRGSNLGQAAGAGTGNIFLSPAPLLVGGGGAPGTTNISIIPWAVGGGTNSATGTTD
ncbi:MAG: hypothetical protein NZ518_10670, partial [Dehalococcoidia bacterium]|nr:hypothetical protein [Dehalococcoidia bacterium]